MKFGLMYEIQIKEPIYPGAEKEVYDQVRVNDPEWFSAGASKG